MALEPKARNQGSKLIFITPPPPRHSPQWKTYTTENQESEMIIRTEETTERYAQITMDVVNSLHDKRVSAVDLFGATMTADGDRSRFYAEDDGE
jgi:hypothetical protein